MKQSLITLSLALASAITAQSSRVLDIPMSITGNKAVSTDGRSFSIADQFGAMEIAGTDGRAWRTDGHTSFLSGNVGDLLDSQSLTARVAFAIDTNAIIGHDDSNADTDGWAKFVDCTDGNQGFAFMLNRRGQFAVRVYVDGRPVEITSKEYAAGKLQLWQWNELAVTVDGPAVKLYLNGNLVGEATAAGTGVKISGDITLGRDKDINGLYCDYFRVGDFNGAIDYLRIDDTAEIPSSFTPAYADLNLPASRYEGDKLRAKFHGQPGMNWTNETHGLFYNEKDGKYHVIFQRTGSVPGMSHAHYGHIVSADLINWQDDKPMIWPTEEYDRRGCWSGCIFTDSKINDGRPAIIYTGVGYAPGESYANIAFCDDDVNLRSWHKTGLGNPIRNYNDTQRDTYFFRVDDNNAYFIIGDRGCMKSYRYDEVNSTWSDNGNFYDFQEGESGYTEMPNVARLSNGKWLMTFTPFTNSVKCIYRIGDINAEGKFVNYTDSQLFDFFAWDGFCVMSPSIGKDKEGNLISLGIVADKMPTGWNYDKGYAHLYSMARLLDTDSEGRLIQKPFKGYEQMFGSVSFESSEAETLIGTKSVDPVRGRQAEVSATFSVGDAPFGINFLQNDKGKGGKVTYNPADHTISLDVTDIVPAYYGMKTAAYPLPIYPEKGEECKIQLFIDHSIVDLFVNDRYASSFRVFPESMDYDLIEVFSNGETLLKNLSAHMIGEGDMRDEPIKPYVFELPVNSGKVAFLKNAEGASIQEQAACNFFTGVLHNSNVITTSEASKIKASDYDCIWIHIDRTGLEKGAYNLPAPFINTELVAALTEYVKAGGNLYLTGQATQMVETVGRIPSAYSPNEYNAGNGGEGSDEWTVNPKLADKYDHSSHAIFNNLQTSDRFDWTTYGLLYGGGSPILREDHNCMWKLSDIDYLSTAADNVARFEEDLLASALATWGQELTDGWAGIVEFYPVQNDDTTWSGTVLANGLAACQWSVTGGNTDYQNLQLLTANAFSYLANADGTRPYNPEGIPGINITPEQPEEPEQPEIAETTGKVALYVGYESKEELFADSAAKEEQAVCTWFGKTYGEDHILFTGDYEQISVNNYDMVWINCDRRDIQSGWENLPGGYTFNSLIETLKNYNAAGGNLYLSKMASQLVVAIERIPASAGVFEWSNGAGGEKNDCWDINVMHQGYDWSSHPMFYGLEFDDKNNNPYWKTATLMSGRHNREDHNCLFKLAELGGHDNFCQAYNANVLATWGHNDTDARNFAGIVEFMPGGSRQEAPHKAISQGAVNARKGTVVTNGFAAYEWAPTGGTNDSQANIENLTSNLIGYLSPVGAVVTGIDEITTEGESATLYFNLQGVRVSNPSNGIFVKVTDGKATKVILK